MLAPDTIAVVPGIESLKELLEPLGRLPWSSWSAFWLSNTLFGRNAVLIFLPLIPALMLLARRHLRLGIVLTGLLFVAYVFGLAYLAFWLLSCLAFYRLSQQFAIEVKRTDVFPWAPPLAAIAIISGYFLAVHYLDNINLPAAANHWLHTWLPWLYPLGGRGTSWEPNWFDTNAEFFEVMLHRSHDIGTAYLVMRMVHYFSEIKRGTIPAEQRSLLNFMAYVCYAPTLIQGPLERFKEFNDEIDTCHQRRSWRNLFAGLGRLGIALAKGIFLVAWYIPWLNHLGLAGEAFKEHPEQTRSYLLLFFSIHLLVALLYLQFSAYCDVAIGMSRLLGYRVVENFRRPWMARSLSDMWRRWHISLSFILRDYIFLPLIRRRWNSVLAVAITFLVCGIWHQLSVGYALWGLLMGLLVAVNQKWARWMRTLDRHPHRRLSAVRCAWLKLQPLPKLCAWLLTLNVFVMTGWVCFWGFWGFRVLWEIAWRPLRWLLASDGP